MSTHVDLSEQPENLDSIERKPKRRSSVELNLKNFTLIRTLGTGSFGRVHLAKSNMNQRYYAIKVLRKTDIVRLKQVEHTKNERAILSEVKYTFIVNLWGTFQDDANLYMVMDYVPGGELFSFMRKCIVSGRKKKERERKWCDLYPHTFFYNRDCKKMSLSFTRPRFYYR